MMIEGLTGAHRATFAQSNVLLSLAFHFRTDDAIAVTVG